MTKKFLLPFLDSGVRKSKTREFLIPDILEANHYFIGIESGKICQYGYVVFTGVDLTTPIVIEKLLRNNLISSSNSRYEAIISQYLEFLKGCKIGSVIAVNCDDGNYEFIITEHTGEQRKSNIP